MQYISNILYWISTGLLVPVIVLLIYFFLRALVLVGTFFGQYLELRHTEKFLQNEFKTLNANNLTSFAERLPKKNKTLVMVFLHRIWQSRHSEAMVEKTLGDFEIAADKDLAISKTLTKMGPMLGLMGTLIPMGPALVGLASGDIASMAYNMQVAFATTVVGLFSSAIGFATLQIKQRWYMQDLNNLEYFAELLKQNPESHETETTAAE
ncbi:MAG: MotA/TolQ/ExbB proton channel family protein [Bacteroidales bacterium]|nr:MotA/TolQ/ExbB proton channel family protein [Bacteroidales bacterium]